jgi:hypothetical protein
MEIQLNNFYIQYKNIDFLWGKIIRKKNIIKLTFWIQIYQIQKSR